MDKIVIVIFKCVIGCIDIMNWCDIYFFFCIDFIVSIFTTCRINELCWILMRWYLFTCIVFINFFIIYTNTWLCTSFSLQSNECINWTFVLNVDTRKVWISYNIINIWCIRIILFATVYVWVNSSISPLLIPAWNLPSLFPSWGHKHHDYLSYFCKILPQYNRN